MRSAKRIVCSQNCCKKGKNGQTSRGLSCFNFNFKQRYFPLGEGVKMKMVFDVFPVQFYYLETVCRAYLLPLLRGEFLYATFAEIGTSWRGATVLK